MFKKCFFLAFFTQKLVPSRIANAIIFGIDEQCGLKFETALFTEGKSYIIFLFHGTRLLFFLYFFFLLSWLSLILALSISLLSLSFPLLDVLPPSLMKLRPEHQGKPISIAVVFFFFFFSL